MSTYEADNKATVQRFIGEIVNEKHYELIEELFTDNYTRHDPANPEMATGPAAWAESLRGLHTAFPDGEVHIGELIAEGDLVAFEGTMTGTHQGAFRGIEPTDTSIEVQGNAMHRVSDGQISETWATWDFLGILTQIDAIEPPAE